MPRRARVLSMNRAFMALLLHRSEFQAQGSRLIGRESDFLDFRRDFLLESRIKIVGVHGRFRGENAVGTGGEAGNLVVAGRTSIECNGFAAGVRNKYDHGGHRRIARGNGSAESGGIAAKRNIDWGNRTGENQVLTK